MAASQIAHFEQARRSEAEGLALVRSYGFDVVRRDPARNTAFAGSLMAFDTEKATGFCIVGDDKAALLGELIDHIQDSL